MSPNAGIKFIVKFKTNKELYVFLFVLLLDK